MKKSHALHGRVSWNSAIQLPAAQLADSHALHGRVSWNELYKKKTELKGVTPYTGVWVEIHQFIYIKIYRTMSRPTRACELKFFTYFSPVSLSKVTPYTGVWVEIYMNTIQKPVMTVTPYTGVWVEIQILPVLCAHICVTPYTGVWVEINFP